MAIERMEMKPLRRRTALKGMMGVLIGGGTSATLLACSGDDGASSSGEGGVTTLRMSWFGNAARAEAIDRSIDLFEAAHPNIVVEREYAAFDAYNERLAAQVAAGDAPDIITSGWESIVRNIPMLTDLNKYTSDLDAQSFTDSDLELTTIDDRLVGLPSSFVAAGSLINKTIFEEAGLDLPDDANWTWEDMIRIGAELTAATPDDVYGLRSFGFGGLYVLFHLSLQAGEMPFGDDGKVTMSDQTLTRFFELVKEASDAKAAPPPDLAIEFAQGGMADLRFGVTPASNAQAVPLQLPNMPPGTELYMALPPGVGKQPESGFFSVGSSWGVTNQSKHAQESFQLLNFLLNNQEAVNAKGLALGIPVNSNVLDGLTQVVDDSTAAALEWAVEMKETATFLPAPHQAWVTSNAVLGAISTDLLQGRLSPAQAGTRFAEQMDELVEKS